MSEAPGTLVPLGLEDYVQAGLIDDVDVEIVEIRACIWDYQGQAPDSLAVRATLKVLPDGDMHEHYWSAGTGFVPSADGCGFVRAEDSTRERLAKGTNWHLMHTSLCLEAGMPKNKLSEKGGLSVLDGAVIHVIRTPEPTRPGLESRPTRREGQPRTTLICKGPAKRWPWDAKGKGAARRTSAGASSAAPAAAAAAPTPAVPPAPAESSDEVAKLAVRAVGEAMADTDSLPLTKFRTLVYNRIGPNTDRDLRTKATNLACDPDFLAENGYVIEENTVAKVPG